MLDDFGIQESGDDECVSANGVCAYSVYSRVISKELHILNL